ncbi:cysteine hydrolase family protein [Sulfitobacter sabulilitoris]|uniref:Cysteine hydrolase n=1 Tax=Sulfitobacter sabulilitoris TaxID=2562655 RepID=A0A5S3Q7R5_9RHOB|nr:cysteine hydrolase family protein [Sulfitobacter sabulilitoris]TMM52903.1 cysteine hydrolase [Sulfitobacter sabulilitoris]
MTDRALILVDIQNDYFDGGLWPVDQMAQVAQTAAAVLDRARAAGDLVIHVHHEAGSETAPFFRPGTQGADIHSSVAPQDGEATVLKHRPNSFHDTDLHARLQAAGVTKVTIVGAMTQMCIDATARAARDLGYEVTLVADACGAKSIAYGDTKLTAEQVQAAFMAPLSMSYGKVVMAADLD